MNLSIRRLSIWIVSLIIILYLVYLICSWSIIVNENYTSSNLFICCILLAIFWYYLICYSIKPIYFRWNKIVNAFIWILIILISQIFLVNSWIEKIFYWDIFSLIWVALTIIWLTNFLISPDVKKEIDDKKIEIIEA